MTPLDRRYKPTFSGQRALQDREEFAWFLQFVRTAGVQRYGEIGARSGDTFHAVMNAIEKRPAVGVAVDLPNSPNREHLEKAVADLCERGHSASVMYGDSTKPATVSQFRGRGPFDLIFIDGHHALEYVTSDWQNYGRLAPIIAFHDIAGTGERNSDGTPVEVPALWKSIKARGQYCTVERIAKGSRMGIGVVWT